MCVILAQTPQRQHLEKSTLLSYQCVFGCVYIELLVLSFVVEIWNILLSGNFHDSYQSASNIPETRALVGQFYRLCEAVSSEEPGAASHCNTAAAGLLFLRRT